jgi:NAD(P)-dependent dehydrogenase (short-subunit alcohol dehydrogenase family)
LTPPIHREDSTKLTGADVGEFDGRVVIVTGAGAGIGREHALQFAAEGAQVVVNDLGTARDGSGSDRSAAQSVVDEIVAAGGTAVASVESVASWDGAKAIVDAAVDNFGDLHVVVNNAGILRDKFLVNMSEEDFDSVVEIHLKGTFAVSRWAATYWRQQSKAGAQFPRRIVNTTSHSGLYGNPGQANYASAKMGIAALTMVSARELERIGVHTNAIAPLGRTRMTTGTPGFQDALKAPDDENAFDIYHPGNNTPLAMLLASDKCQFNGQVFEVLAGKVSLLEPWTRVETLTADRRWTLEELQTATKEWPVGPPPMPGV